MHNTPEGIVDAFALHSVDSRWLVTAGFALVALVSLCAYSTWTYSTFSSQGIPGPRPLPLIGNATVFFNMDPVKWQMDYARKYGKVYGMYLGRRPALLVADPELIKNIAVKQFDCFTNRMSIRGFSDKPWSLVLPSLLDDHWKHVRAAISPVFTSGKLKEMATTISDCADSLVTCVSQHNGQDIDVKEIMSAFSLDTIAGTAFGLDVRSYENPENQFLKHAMMFTAVTDKLSLKKAIITALCMMSKTVGNFLAKIGLTVLDPKCLTYFEEVAMALFNRDDYSEGRKNFVQLCKSQLVEIENVNKDSLRSTAGLTWTTEGLLADELTSNAIVFFLAGYDTTSSLLAVFFYAMATNPDVQERLYAELRSSLGETPPSHDNVKDIAYLDWCIDETLRMYPPVPRLDRVCGKDTQVGGVRVTAGTLILFPVYAIHHDPTYWPEPDVFRPERFSPDECRNRPASAHVPFGFGPRSCIGMRLAQLEAKLAIVKIISSYAVGLGNSMQNKPLKWKNNFFLLVPQDRIKLCFRKRQL